ASAKRISSSALRTLAIAVGIFARSGASCVVRHGGPFETYAVTHAATMSANPRSLPPIDSTTSLTLTWRARVASWSACGGSPLKVCPPLWARQMFAVTAPEQAMLIFWATLIAALLISATSERWQPLVSDGGM